MDTLKQLFESFGIDLPKFGAQLILFIIVYILLSKYAFGPVLAMLNERRRRIEEGQHNAEKIKRQLAESELRYQEVLRKANDEAAKLLEAARLSSEANNQKSQQEAIKSAEGIIERAREAITQDRNKMVADVRHEMVGLVVKTTAAVTGKVLTPDDQKRLTDETARQLAA